MAPQYKLLYFDFKALGEPIRFLLAYGNIPYEDYRYTEDEWYSDLKAKAPFGQGPILEVDGKRIWQNTAILRYLAGKMDLRGVDDWEDFQIDMIAETIFDLRCLLYFWYFDESENKEKNKDKVLNIELPYLLERLDKTVEKNGGHFVNGKLTWPDLQYAAFNQYFCNMSGGDLDEKYPNLRKLRQKVEEIPQIKAWIEKRPVTEW